MTPYIEFRRKALLDIDEIVDYIARDNSHAARRFYDAAQSAVTRLVEMPGLGRLREFDNPRW